jgi:hypothetical protein
MSWLRATLLPAGYPAASWAQTQRRDWWPEARVAQPLLARIPHACRPGPLPGGTTTPSPARRGRLGCGVGPPIAAPGDRSSPVDRIGWTIGGVLPGPSGRPHPGQAAGGLRWRMRAPGVARPRSSRMSPSGTTMGTWAGVGTTPRSRRASGRGGSSHGGRNGRVERPSIAFMSGRGKPCRSCRRRHRSTGHGAEAGGIGRTAGVGRGHGVHPPPGSVLIRPIA